MPELLSQYYDYRDSADEWEKRFAGRLHVVYFDDFISTKSIRQKLADDLGLRYVPVNLDEVDTRFGAGSSFAPGSENAPPVSQLKSRWKQVKSDPIFLSWVADYLALTSENQPKAYMIIKDELSKEGVTVMPASKSFLNRCYRSSVVSIARLLRQSNTASNIRKFLRLLIR